MNTTKKGNAFEERIFSLFQQLVAEGRYPLLHSACRYFRKKEYYSRLRESHIVFDIAVESWMPDAENFSQVLIIECKDLGRLVEVSDIEEFSGKIEQVQGSVKGIVAARRGFQSGAMKIAKAKGIGLFRYRDEKWVLPRSPALAVSHQPPPLLSILAGLTQVDHPSSYFNCYFASPTAFTISLVEFLRTLCGDGLLGRLLREEASPTEISIVPFRPKEEIEAVASHILRDLDYSGGAVPLRRLCALEATKSGLALLLDCVPSEEDLDQAHLAQITFTPLEIRLFRQAVGHAGRDRFTLAHELGHYYLGHSRYMQSEYCDDTDFEDHGSDSLRPIDIRRLDWQANYFASCLLMPLPGFLDAFHVSAEKHDVTDRGHGPLYVDHQPSNLKAYKQITDDLIEQFRVSRQAATIRLQSLGLMRDVRQPAPKPIRQLLSPA